MTTDERLALIRLKIERAKTHIFDLKTRLGAFFALHPYKVGAKRDPNTRCPIYYLTSVKDIPPEIGLIAGDAINNSRSALDHLAYQLYMVGPGGQAGGIGSRIYFPIADDSAKYKAESPRKVNGLSQAAIKAIDAIEPYKGGQTDKSDMLWRLEKMNNIDKHRLLVAVGSQFRSVDIGGDFQRDLEKLMAKGPPEIAARIVGPIPKIDVFLQPADRMWPLKAGDELFIDAPDADVDENRQFRFEVAFGESRVIEGEQIVETLQHMADLVDNLISSFKPLLV
jgi:hypothetical protein